MSEVMRTLEANEAEYQQEAYRFCLSIRDEAKTFDPEDIADDEGNPSIDVRIQVSEDGGCSFHSGDASYDTDHRGFWGASSVSPADGEWECIQTGRDLVEQALEHASQVLC